MVAHLSPVPRHDPPADPLAHLRDWLARADPAFEVAVESGPAGRCDACNRSRSAACRLHDRPDRRHGWQDMLIVALCETHRQDAYAAIARAARQGRLV